MSTANVVNPGLVNVADQSDGEIRINQTIKVSKPSTNSGPTAQGIAFADGMVKKNQSITISPSTNAGPTTHGGDLAPGQGVAATDPSDVTPPMTAQRSVNGGTASPVSPNTIDTTPNTVVTQPTSVQQFNRTINVYP
jgi:hypothetical protein